MRAELRHGLCWLSVLHALASADARAQAAPASTQRDARPELAFAPEGVAPDAGGSGANARQRARQLTAQASAAYRSGDYPAALERFEQAYALVPAAELLFNLGQCQRQLGRDAQAHESFRAYLRARPNAPERAQIERWLASSAREPAREVRRERPRREAQPALAPSRARLPKAAPEPARAAVVERTLVTPPAARDHSPHSPVRRDDARTQAERDEQGSIVERWWFWTAVGLAVGGGITATLLLRDDDEPAAAGSLGTVRWD
jgi:tetratricopeptide (TPR) repeat protein